MKFNFFIFNESPIQIAIENDQCEILQILMNIPNLNVNRIYDVLYAFLLIILRFKLNIYS